MQPPKFWVKRNFISVLLGPFAWIYGRFSELRFSIIKPLKFNVPVICIGNFTLGGTGKTPCILLLAERLVAAGYNVHVVSRGYGGSLNGPLQVDLNKHRADQVGDEPILIAEKAPCWIAKKRIDGIRSAITSGANLILLDDGLQNPHFVKDFSITMIDGPFGFGNRYVFPAGPLRERIQTGLKRTSVFIIVGEDNQKIKDTLAVNQPIFTASLEPDLSAAQLPASKPVFAFAGIGRPEKFFESLRAKGVHLIKTKTYPDHYLYKTSDIECLLTTAKDIDASVVTTSKDITKIHPKYHDEIKAIPAHLNVNKLEELLALIQKNIPS